MSVVRFNINKTWIKKLIKDNLEIPLQKISDPKVVHQVAEEALRIVNPYVPKRSGALRYSGRVTSHAGRINVVWGSPNIFALDSKGRETNKATSEYASIQYYANDAFWRRTTLGTKSFWFEDIRTPGTSQSRRLAEFAYKLCEKEFK